MDESTSRQQSTRSSPRAPRGDASGPLRLEQAASLLLNPVPAVLYEHALQRGEGMVAGTGGLVVDTGHFTGRSPSDKFIVRNRATRDLVDWGEINQPLEQAAFDRLQADMEAHLEGMRLYVQDLHAGSDPRYRVPVRIVTEYAWHSLFAHNLFVRAPAPHDRAEWVVVDLPSFRADPERHGTHTSTVVAMDFDRKLVLIGDTEYGGEIKKSIFSALNLALPEREVLPMHCSANATADGRVALFFGLSGTGKTTLSVDGERTLIGDDEHGWSDAGIFNFEGGCYAKTIRLSEAAEPEIYTAAHRFGTVLENVRLLSDSRDLDFDDESRTENTRAAYPLDFMPNTADTTVGGHPRDIVFLTADAFGVLPPIARLSVEQAMYHFLSGYTAKVAGTERGVTDPAATFSACFGAPFMPLPPIRYARMLGERVRRHGSRVWLVNTGWTGGPYGVGERMRLSHTRALVRAALGGDLDDVPYAEDAVFGLAVPRSAPGVPAEVLSPRDTWDDGDAFDRQAAKLAAMFDENFGAFRQGAPPEVAAAGPRRA